MVPVAASTVVPLCVDPVRLDACVPILVAACCVLTVGFATAAACCAAVPSFDGSAPFWAAFAPCAFWFLPSPLTRLKMLFTDDSASAAASPSACACDRAVASPFFTAVSAATAALADRVFWGCDDIWAASSVTVAVSFGPEFWTAFFACSRISGETVSPLATWADAACCASLDAPLVCVDAELALASPAWADPLSAAAGAVFSLAPLPAGAAGVRSAAPLFKSRR